MDHRFSLCNDVSVFFSFFFLLILCKVIFEVYRQGRQTMELKGKKDERNQNLWIFCAFPSRTYTKYFDVFNQMSVCRSIFFFSSKVITAWFYFIVLFFSIFTSSNNFNIEKWNQNKARTTHWAKEKKTSRSRHGCEEMHFLLKTWKKKKN